MTARTTRRTLFGAGASMLLLVPGAAGAEKAWELDGELLTACAHYQRLEAEWRVMIAGPDDVDGVPEGYDDAIDAVAAIPARTPEGLQAKTAAILAFWGGPKGRDAMHLDRPHERMEWSLILDMAGRDVA